MTRSHFLVVIVIVASLVLPACGDDDPLVPSTNSDRFTGTTQPFKTDGRTYAAKKSGQLTAILTWSADVHMALGISRLSGCAPNGCAGVNAYDRYLGQGNTGYSKGKITLTWQVNQGETKYLYVHNADFNRESSWTLIVSLN